MHPEQLQPTVDTVRGLLATQFPAWRHLPLQPVSTQGTVNAVFRLGTELAVRLPVVLQELGETRARLRAEVAAARALALSCTVPTPEPLALGEPQQGYPLPWSVWTWLPGHDATVEDPAPSMAFAHDLALLIAGLRAADTHGRHFDGSGRGGHLSDHDEWLDVCFRESAHLLDVPLLRKLWHRFRALPSVDADVMCHGDLTPPNVLVRAGRLVGVLDGGGFAPADPALDLVAAWHLLDDGPRAAVRAELDCGDVQWLRGTAWAFQQAMGLVWYYVDSNPAMSQWGRRTLDRIVASGTE